MKRTVAWMVSGMFLAGVVPASAGDAMTTVTPNPVRHGKSLTIEATDCITTGPFESPFVETSIVNSGGDEVYSSSVPGDNSDAVNTLKIKIRKAKYPAGTYTVHVDCFMDDEFDIADRYTYQETHELKVKRKRKS